METLCKGKQSDIPIERYLLLGVFRWNQQAAKCAPPLSVFGEANRHGQVDALWNIKDARPRFFVSDCLLQLLYHHLGADVTLRCSGNERRMVTSPTIAGRQHPPTTTDFRVVVLSTPMGIDTGGMNADVAHH